MPARLRFLLCYFLLWIAFFEAARILFLLAGWSQLKTISLTTALATLWYGARMDASMAAYIALPVSVFLLASFFVVFLRRPIVYQVYTAILLLPVLPLLISDVEVYKQWGFRMDATPLKYLSSPKEAWASVSHLPVFWYLLLFLLLYTALLFGVATVLRRMCWRLAQTRPWWIELSFLLLATGALIIPLRGGFQQTPLNQSSVYFSNSNFANQAALNAPWNFLYGVLSETASGSADNPYKYMPATEAKNLVDSLYQKTMVGSDTTGSWFSPNPNIIVIIWESGTAKMLDTSINGIPVAPGLRKLVGEGRYFANAWASGDRTDKGLPAVLSGYPALPQSSIIRLPNKARKIESLPNLLRKQGYSTSFYYGGEPEFANIKSYLLGAGFDPLVEKDDFAAKDQNSKWGAHDGVVADRVFNDLSKTGTPFFTTWLTLSSHEPFETPVPTVIDGNDDTHLFLNSLHYTDSIIYHFVERCKTQAWWSNTLIVIVADHGHPLPETGHRIDNFKIPILMVGGALAPGKIGIDSTTTSQLDIAGILNDQVSGLRGRQLSFPFAKTHRTTEKRWAFFSFNNGFGFVQDSNWVLFDNVGSRVLEQSRGATPAMIRAGQAMQQFTYQDYLDK
jgi:phosphoglycerol transferase MdoB-like AlkP superfamily enzyme